MMNSVHLKGEWTILWHNKTQLVALLGITALLLAACGGSQVVQEATSPPETAVIQATSTMLPAQPTLVPATDTPEPTDTAAPTETATLTPEPPTATAEIVATQALTDTGGELDPAYVAAAQGALRYVLEVMPIPGCTPNLADAENITLVPSPIEGDLPVGEIECSEVAELPECIPVLLLDVVEDSVITVNDELRLYYIDVTVECPDDGTIRIIGRTESKDRIRQNNFLEWIYTYVIIRPTGQ
jgi:hypothetical protein